MDNIIRFDNGSGHRQSLINMGILEDGETQISIDDLVKRTLDQDKLNRVFDVLNNELRNRKMLLDFSDAAFDEAKEAVEAIHDRQTLQAAKAAANAVEKSLEGPAKQADLVMRCLTEFEKQMTRRPRRLSGQLSELAIKHLQAIVTFAPQILEDTEKKRNAIKAMKALIEERGKTFDP